MTREELYEEIDSYKGDIEKLEDKISDDDWVIMDYKLTIKELTNEIENNIKVGRRCLEENIPEYVKKLLKSHIEFDKKLLKIIKGE